MPEHRAACHCSLADIALATSARDNSTWLLAWRAKSNDKDDIDAVLDKLIQDDQVKVKKKKRKAEQEQVDPVALLAEKAKKFEGAALKEAEKKEAEKKAKTASSVVLNWRTSRVAPINDRPDEPKENTATAFAAARAVISGQESRDKALLDAEAKEKAAMSEMEILRATISDRVPKQEEENQELQVAEQAQLLNGNVPAWQQADRPWLGVEKPLIPEESSAQNPQFNMQPNQQLECRPARWTSSCQLTSCRLVCQVLLFSLEAACRQLRSSHSQA